MEFPGIFLTNTVQQQIAFRCGLLQLTFFSSKALASHLFGDSALCAFILDWAIYSALELALHAGKLPYPPEQGEVKPKMMCLVESFHILALRGYDLLW